MNLTTTPRAIVTLCLATLLSAPSAIAFQTEDGAAEALTNLIDPPAAGTQQDQAPSLAMMKQVVEDLIAQDSGESIEVFGESAGPALRAILEESSLDSLVQSGYGSPLNYITSFAPLSGLQYFSDLQRSSTFHYEALVRGEFPPLNFVGTAATEGASRALYLDLLDRTIASGSLDLEVRLEMAAGSLAGGLSTPSSRSFIERNAELALRKHGNWASSTLDVVLPTPESITANLPKRIALAALDHRASMSAYEALSSSPHVMVREKVARALGMGALPLPRPIDRRLALLYQLSSDPVPSVEQRADDSIHDILESSLIQLDIEAVTELIAKVGYKTTLGTAMNRRLVGETARTFDSATPAQVELLYRTFLGSPNSQLKQGFRSAGHMPIEQCVAYFNAASEASEAVREAALDSIGKSIGQIPISSARRASGVLNTLLSDSMQQGEEVVFLNTVISHGLRNNVRQQISDVLWALPANRAGEALRWLAAHSSQFGAMAFASPGSWKDAGPEMRAIFASSQSSIRLKLIAGAALVNSGAGNEADADAMTQLLVELCKVPSAHEDVKWFLKYKGSGANSVGTPRWNSVTAAVLRNQEVPDVIANEFALSGVSDFTEEKAVIQAVLEAAEQRAIKAKGAITFRNIAYFGLRAMLEDPALLQPNLVRGWISMEAGASSEVISVIIASGDASLIRSAMNHLLAGIVASSSAYDSMKMADQLLRLPGDEPVQRLLEVTLRSGLPEFVGAVEKRVAERLRIREAALRWSNLASGGTSIDSAKARVLKLIDSPNSDVRIEAIYGLGTLGAIESLPRLIELVGSEHQAEREAAKETLMLLRDRSANAPVTGSNEPQSPKTKE